MAFLKMTAAAPTVLERSSDVDKRTERNLVAEGFSEDLAKRYYLTYSYLVSEETPETEEMRCGVDLVAEETTETEDVKKRSFIISDSHDDAECYNREDVSETNRLGRL
ncbi:hypothetical protein K503DRAFT_784690 [Rhizopogon vinicolor AM-OR11-026]|uniref:Uncharacterized protein n=1 Tax=Rhizopogon vinicolor AM-OR11-026 TaxID=1314800 RepID=A0A1B7MTT2_9AGAM|nr:hypothetical protein K503DRAFT_784690 [Rhizopogon vinicolor AM-OR11-026]